MATSPIVDFNSISQTNHDLTINRIVNTWSEQRIQLFLSRRKFDVNKKNSQGYTALARFLIKKKVSERDKSIIKMLLDNGANPLFTHEALSGHTLISMSLRSKDPELAILMLSYVEDINCIVNLYFKSTPLHFATEWEDETVLKYVLSRNPDVYKRDTEGSSALHRVTRNKNGLAMAECLLNHVLHLELHNEKGHTPLMDAVFENRPDLVKLLIAKGANLESRDGEGNTAILLACWMKKLEMVKLLKDSGANLLVTNFHGCNALVSLFVTKIGKSNLELFKFLMDAGCDINALNFFNQSPFHYMLASFTNRTDWFYVDEFIRYGVHLNIQNSRGNSELHICAQNRSAPLGLIIYLIKQGANASLRNNQNQTFFDILIRKNQNIAVELIRYSVATERTGIFKLPLELRNHFNGNETWVNFLNSCISEADLLNSKMVISNLSFLEFSFIKKKELIMHCRNDQIRTALKNFDDSNFPIYGKIIGHTCRITLDLYERENYCISLLEKKGGEDLDLDTLITILNLIPLNQYNKIYY